MVRRASLGSTIWASMGPPTISADQLGGYFWMPFEYWQASMGPPTISADQLQRQYDQLQRDVSASMGPPTISADQRPDDRTYRNRRPRFNGAADDLGGSTELVQIQRSHPHKLQWGRRRSRRINDADIELIDESSIASMGPPTISADQRPLDPQRRPPWGKLQWGRRRSRRINPKAYRRETCQSGSFNGAADDLGGSTR